MRGLATNPIGTCDSRSLQGGRRGFFHRPGGMRADRRTRAPRLIKARRMKDGSSRQPDEDDLLTVRTAAALAERSIRTIQRAYGTGKLLAYRDGNGRGVRIRYGDLRQWMMATSAIAPRRREEEPRSSNPIERLDMGGRTPVTGPSENLALLNAARARQQSGVASGDAARRRVAG